MLRTGYSLPSCSSPSSFDISLWVMLPNLWLPSLCTAGASPVELHPLCCPWTAGQSHAQENKRISLWVLCGCDALGSSWCSIWFITMQAHGSVFGLQSTVRWYKLHLQTNNFLTLHYFCLNVKPSVSLGWMTSCCFHTIFLISQDCYKSRVLLPHMPVVILSPACCLLI